MFECNIQLQPDYRTLMPGLLLPYKTPPQLPICLFSASSKQANMSLNVPLLAASGTNKATCMECYVILIDYVLKELHMDITVLHSWQMHYPLDINLQSTCILHSVVQLTGKSHYVPSGNLMVKSKATWLCDANAFHIKFLCSNLHMIFNTLLIKSIASAPTYIFYQAHSKFVGWCCTLLSLHNNTNTCIISSAIIITEGIQHCVMLSNICY